MSNVDDLSKEVRELLITELSLKVSPEELPVDQPLLDARRPGGVAIDSLDMLSLVLAIEDRYGVKLPDDVKELTAVFTSVRSVAENIMKLQVQALRS